MKSSQLLETTLVRHASELSKGLIDKLHQAKKKGLPTEQVKFSVHEGYVEKVLLSAGELVSVCTQLEQTPAYLKNFRSTPLIKRQGITRFDHVTYHLEAYFIRAASVFDRSLILTNDVLRLGNPPRNCTRGVILQNSYVTGSTAGTKLLSIDKLVTRFREQRHASVHRATYSDRYLGIIGMMHNVGKERPAAVRPQTIKFFTDKYVRTKALEFQLFSQQINPAVAALMEALAPQFETHYEALKASATGE